MFNGEDHRLIDNQGHVLLLTLSTLGFSRVPKSVKFQQALQKDTQCLDGSSLTLET